MLIVLAAIIISAARAAENEATDPVQERLRIDRIMGALDDPTLRRAQARVAPDWRGPRGAPPFTERRSCPTIDVSGSDLSLPPFTPAFC